MLNRKIVLAIVFIAALGGWAAGRYHPQTLVGVAQANVPEPVKPDWKDLHIVYLKPTEDNAVANALNLLDATQKEVVQIANDAYDVAKQSQAVGLDILMFHKSSLVQFDAQWGAKQFRQGTAFVGINVSPQELGELIDMPAITSNWGYILKEPFVTYMVIQVYGNPDHIKKAEQAGALYPPNGEILAKLGFRDLMVGQGSGYTDLRNTELSMILEGIRLNLDRQNLVKPSLP